MPKDRTNKISCNHYTDETEVALEVISGKWKALILLLLARHQVIRYNHFLRLIPNITKKMLTQQLRSLEQNKLILRIEYPQLPPMVEYQLSEAGTGLVPILQDLQTWGKTYIAHYQQLTPSESVRRP